MAMDRLSNLKVGTAS